MKHETWEEMLDSKSNMVSKYCEIVFKNLDKICPEEEVKVTKFDGQVISLALQRLARLKLREFTKHRNSKRFKKKEKKQD